MNTRKEISELSNLIDDYVTTDGGYDFGTSKFADALIEKLKEKISKQGKYYDAFYLTAVLSEIHRAYSSMKEDKK